MYEIADVEAADEDAAYEEAWENLDTKWELVDAETIEIVERKDVGE